MLTITEMASTISLSFQRLYWWSQTNSMCDITPTLRMSFPTDRCSSISYFFRVAPQVCSQLPCPWCSPGIPQGWCPPRVPGGALQPALRFLPLIQLCTCWLKATRFRLESRTWKFSANYCDYNLCLKQPEPLGSCLQESCLCIQSLSLRDGESIYPRTFLTR